MDAKPKRAVLGVFLATLTMALAGCTGDFQINQTEPFRVQVDDDRPETVQVAEDDDGPRRIIVENRPQADTVDVEVKVTPTSPGPVIVLVQVVDEDDDRLILAEKEIRVPEDDDEDDGPDDPGDDNGTGGNHTGGNETRPPERPPADDGQAPIVIQNVNVQGKDNFVVLTQATQGDADVDILTVSGAGSDDDTPPDQNETQP